MMQLPKDIMISDGMPDSISGKAALNAAKAGHAVANIIYPGDGLNGDLPGNYTLVDRHLVDSNRYLLRANKSMHRSWPRQGMATDNSLRRDIYLVRWTERIYLFGLFTQDASLLKIHTDVAWAAQMYVDRFMYDREPFDMCELYMFDLKSEGWWLWRKHWAMVSSVPRPHGVYTVLGKDRLTSHGKVALAKLWI